MVVQLFHSTGTPAGTLEQTRNSISADPGVDRSDPHKVLVQTTVAVPHV